METDALAPELPPKRHIWTIVVVIASALSCAATFLFALYRQLALVEVAASIATGVQLYFLSSSIGDWLEEKRSPNRSRRWIAIGVAAGVVGYFVIAGHFG
jgi:drug/metabolite transporter (DMT)-like permease